MGNGGIRETVQKKGLSFIGKKTPVNAVEESDKKDFRFDDDAEDPGSDHDQEDIADLPEPNESTGATRKRNSVSAEVYGTHELENPLVPPVYPKSEEQRDALSTTLSNSFLFTSQDPENFKTLLDAFKAVEFEEGQTFITQGEEGNELYVVESGSAEVFRIDEDGKETLVNTMLPGEVVGELALMYNSPRAATVKAKEKMQCWLLDRETFNQLVRRACVARRNQFVDFLKKVSVLADMNDYERNKIADVLKSETFKEGVDIINQGDSQENTTFYILRSGEAQALKDSVVVKSYQPGDYFGELALLKNQPRAATVRVTSEEAEVVYLDRKSFTRLLGPIQHILERNAENYQNVCAQLDQDSSS